MNTNTDSNAILHIETLGKQYANASWGIRHASTSFQAGQMVAVLGPNGAGKSTLIHMLAGAIAPTEGRISVDDTKRIGWSSQRTTIDWYLDVRQNIEIGGRIYGLSRQECRIRANALLDRFHLTNLANNDVSMLSGGQQQRIQVARTLMSEPDILLLDEPTASLDVESAEQVLGFLQERARSGALVLVSSHDLGLLERYCDQVLFILEGRVLAHQSLTTFLNRYATADTIALTLDTAVNDRVLHALATYFPASVTDEHQCLTVSVPEGNHLGDLVLALQGVANVIDVTRTPASLRNVYLQLAATKEESK